MNYEYRSHGITFCVDYYVELLGVLYILCQDQEAVCDAGYPVCNEAYVQEVKHYFQNTQYTELTQTLERFSDEYNFNYDAPVSLMLMLSNQQPINKEELFRERKYIPDGAFDKFLKGLFEFERSSNFKAFYQSHLPLYQTILQRFIQDYECYNSHAYLVEFLKLESTREYCINLMLGITNANYGVSAGNRVYCNICPYEQSRYSPHPDYSYEPIYYSTLVLHEFAHAFINPAVANYRKIVEGIDISKYAAELDNFCYGDSMETLINETIIRALECLYVKWQFPQWYQKYVQYNEEEGYTKLPAVIDILSDTPDILKAVQLFQ